MSGDIQCHRCGLVARLHSCYSCADGVTAALNAQVERLQGVAMRLEAERDGAMVRADKAEADLAKALVERDEARTLALSLDGALDKTGEERDEALRLLRAAYEEDCGLMAWEQAPAWLKDEVT